MFPGASAFLDALMFDVLAAAFAVIAAAAVRDVAASVASVACAFAPAAEFSPHWRSALCIVDAHDLAVAGVFAALDPASWPYLPAAFDTSDLTLYSPYSELPDVDTRADLSDALDYWCAPSQLGWFPSQALLRVR